MGIINHAKFKQRKEDFPEEEPVMDNMTTDPIKDDTVNTKETIELAPDASLAGNVEDTNPLDIEAPFTNREEVIACLEYIKNNELLNERLDELPVISKLLKSDLSDLEFLLDCRELKINGFDKRIELTLAALTAEKEAANQVQQDPMIQDVTPRTPAPKRTSSETTQKRGLSEEERQAIIADHYKDSRGAQQSNSGGGGSIFGGVSELIGSVLGLKKAAINALTNKFESAGIVDAPKNEYDAFRKASNALAILNEEGVPNFDKRLNFSNVAASACEEMESDPKKLNEFCDNYREDGVEILEDFHRELSKSNSIMEKNATEKRTKEQVEESKKIAERILKLIERLKKKLGMAPDEESELKPSSVAMKA